MLGGIELVIASGELAGKRFRIGDKPLKLGRASSNDIGIAGDERLSRIHCLFEPDGSGGAMIMDLASANGTYLNGKEIGTSPVAISPGDVIDVGFTTIRVAAVSNISDRPAPETESPGADLGLDASAAEGASTAPDDVRGPRIRTIAVRAAAVAAVVAAVAAVAFFPVGKTASDGEPSARPLGPSSSDWSFISLSYEKVEGDHSRIFRFCMKVDRSGRITVEYDDLPGEKRHVDKSRQLSAAALARIAEIADIKRFSGFDDAYSGSGVADGFSYEMRRIRLVGTTSVKDVRVENTVPPAAFKAIADELETFARNELGIWAMQYPREKLLSLSRASEELGDSKWAERDVIHSNIALAIKAYREAMFYLETVDPKPANFKALSEKLEKAVGEQSSRYEEQRFLANKAVNMGDWAKARDELRVMCETISDRSDPRYAEADAKLVDVEKRLSRLPGGGK